MNSCLSPSSLTTVIGKPGANSLKAWRHAPHGYGVRPLALTTRCLKARAPSVTAAKSATRSAQQVTENDEFSTLQPWNTRPSSVSKAAPTWYPEYGA